jgi:hypothetical protein
MAEEQRAKPEQDSKGRFVTGNIGGGRPKGARAKLGEAFIQAMHDSFLEHGTETIEKVRTEKPDQYLKVIASLLPSEHRITVNDQFSEMTDDELAERVRQLTATLAPLLDGIGEPVEAAGGKESAKLPSRVH